MFPKITLILHDYVVDDFDEYVGRAQIIPIDRIDKASKGSVRFFSRHHPFIAENLMYNDFIKEIKDCSKVIVRGITLIDKRTYTLFSVTNTTYYRMEKNTSIGRKGESVTVNGVEIYPVVQTEEIRRVKETVSLSKTVKKELFSKNEHTLSIANSVNADEIWLFDPISGKFAYANESSMDVYDIERVDERVLLDLSQYYVIAFPLMIARVGEKYRQKYALYYNGKREVVRLTSKRKIIPPLFRVQRMKYSVKGVPKGKVIKDWEEFSSVVLNLHGCEGVKKRVHPVDEFLEKYYVSPSKRVRKKLYTYYNLVQTLREYGYEARAEVAIGGFYSGAKIDNRIKLSKVKSTAIFLKKDIPKGDRWLLDFLKMDRNSQLKILREEIADLVHVEGLTCVHDIMKRIAKLPTQYRGILGEVSQFIRQARWITSDEITCCLDTLARMGLCLPPDDKYPDPYTTTLKVVRAAVKYGLKARGYTEKGEWRVKGGIEELKRVFGNSRLSALLFDLAVPEEKGGDISVDRIKLIN